MLQDAAKGYWGSGCGCRAMVVVVGPWLWLQGAWTKGKEKIEKINYFFFISILGVVGTDTVGEVMGSAIGCPDARGKKKLTTFFCGHPYQVWSAHMWWSCWSLLSLVRHMVVVDGHHLGMGCPKLLPLEDRMSQH
jgi:hypothetical protein